MLWYTRLHRVNKLHMQGSRCPTHCLNSVTCRVKDGLHKLHTGVSSDAVTDATTGLEQQHRDFQGVTKKIPIHKTTPPEIKTLCTTLGGIIKSKMTRPNGKNLSDSHKIWEEENLFDSSRPLYEDHIPTNFFQKTFLSIGAASVSILNPWRHDMVAVLGETTGFPALTRLYTQMVEDQEGQMILMDKPRINSTTVDLSYLLTLPDDTLGNYYIKFLSDNKVTPDSRLPVQFVDDPELAYVMQRYREGHDLFHTVLGMPTNMLGEVAVKWVEAIQTGLPMCYAAAVFGPLRFRPKQRNRYLSTYLPWALKVGRSSKLLMNIYFEKRWEQPIVDLRNELGIDEPPKV